MELPNARPYAFRFRPESTTLVTIDMQRDFLEPGGFGSIQCGDDKVFHSVRRIVPVLVHLQISSSFASLKYSLILSFMP